MTTLVVGATGATGRLLVAQLLERGVDVRAIVRDPARLPDTIRDHARLDTRPADLARLSDEQWAEHLHGCDAAASCLGHNLTFKGVFGPPRRLVADVTTRLVAALRAAGRVAANADEHAPPPRFVLMNSAGVRDPTTGEKVSTAHAAVITLLRWLLPPHADNEAAAAHLRDHVRDAADVQWAIVRPDALVDHDRISPYTLHPSPTRDPIFNSGQTSRINVGHFIAELLTNDETWARWTDRAPVLYNDPSHGLAGPQDPPA